MLLADTVGNMVPEPEELLFGIMSHGCKMEEGAMISMSFSGTHEVLQHLDVNLGKH